MKIITISAKARGGKDYTAKLLKEQLEAKNKRVLIAHYADLLKYIMKTFFGWDGKKDEAGRTKLQYVGTDVIRKERPDYWVDFIVSILQLFPNEWDYVIIPDTRFPNENNKLKCQGFNVYTLRVNRPNFDNGLTEEQRQHESEIALDNYLFDYYMTNSGDDTFKNEVDQFISWMEDDK